MQIITLERVIRFLTVAAIIVAGLYIMWSFSLLLVYIVSALVLSYMLDPFVNRMQSAGMNRSVAIFIVLISVALFIIWASSTIIPNVGNQIGKLAQQFNIETISFILRSIEEYSIQHIPYLTEGYLTGNLSNILNQVFTLDDAQKWLGNVVGVFTNLAAALIILPLATFFFLRDGSKLRRQILQFVPNRYFETTITILSKTEHKLGVHFRGVALQSTLVALLSWILLLIAGLDNALSVGIAIGIANTIPYFGPVLGYLLSIIIAIIETGDFSLVLNCIMAVAAVQIMDNAVFYPSIFSRTSEIHPLYVLIIILIGAQVAGILGMLIAIPIATVLRVIIMQVSWSLKNYYVFKGESTASPPPTVT